jgi:hypothetical protein
VLLIIIIWLLLLLLLLPKASARSCLLYASYLIRLAEPDMLLSGCQLDCLQERLTNILEFFANYKQAENKPAPCFWPAAAPPVTAASSPNPPASNTTAGSAGAAKAAAACSLSASAVAKPADFYHGRNATLEVSWRSI